MFVKLPENCTSDISCSTISNCFATNIIIFFYSIAMKLFGGSNTVKYPGLFEATIAASRFFMTAVREFSI